MELTSRRGRYPSSAQSPSRRSIIRQNPDRTAYRSEGDEPPDIIRRMDERIREDAPEALAALEAIDSAAALQPLADRLLEVESWQELLGRE